MLGPSISARALDHTALASSLPLRPLSGSYRRSPQHTASPPPLRGRSTAYATTNSLATATSAAAAAYTGPRGQAGIGRLARLMRPATEAHVDDASGEFTSSEDIDRPGRSADARESKFSRNRVRAGDALAEAPRSPLNGRWSTRHVSEPLFGTSGFLER